LVKRRSGNKNPSPITSPLATIVNPTLSYVHSEVVIPAP
jgi:hypothetical protein